MILSNFRIWINFRSFDIEHLKPFCRLITFIDLPFRLNLILIIPFVCELAQIFICSISLVSFQFLSPFWFRFVNSENGHSEHRAFALQYIYKRSHIWFFSFDSFIVFFFFHFHFSHFVSKWVNDAIRHCL